jgi:hypothetical protein
MPLLVWRTVAVVLCAGAVGACSAAIRPIHRLDAQTAVRVKTALINDSELGVLPIEVHVASGVVTLSGRVRTQAEADRAEALAGGVPGVTAVSSNLHVVGAAPAPGPSDQERPPSDGLLDADLKASNQKRLLAVGGTIGWSRPAEDRLASGVSVGPLIRLGSGHGFGPAVAFGWYGTDVHSAVDSRRLAHLRIRPVMAGVALRRSGDRFSTSVELVAGVAFNGVHPRTPIHADELPVDVSSSFVWRPGTSLWVDLNARLAIGLSAGYAVTRPRLTTIEDGSVRTRRVHADALLVKTGLVYKLF